MSGASLIFMFVNWSIFMLPLLFDFFFVSAYKLNPKSIQIYVPPFITSIKYSFSFPLNFRFACSVGMLYCNISQFIHITYRGWCLPNFGSSFLQINMDNRAMPLNPCSKWPPYIVFFVLFLFHVVCVLYFSCCVKLSLFKFFFSAFLKLKEKWVSLDASILLSRVSTTIKSEERDTYWPVLKSFQQDFCSKLLFFNFFLFRFFLTECIALSFFNIFFSPFLKLHKFLDFLVASECCINVLYEICAVLESVVRGLSACYINMLYACCCCWYWPPVREFCPNCEVVEFQPQTLTTPDLGSVAYCYVNVLDLPHPPLLPSDVPPPQTFSSVLPMHRIIWPPGRHPYPS